MARAEKKRKANKPGKGDTALARYQTALIALLARTDVDASERMRLLREGAAFAPYADYVETFQRPLVALGAATLEEYVRPSGKKRKE